jgi:hypothetical protein
VDPASESTSVGPVPRKGWNTSSMIQPASIAARLAPSDTNGFSSGPAPQPFRDRTPDRGWILCVPEGFVLK